MKFAEKEFSEYWKIIKIPTYIMVAWSLIGFVIAISSFSLYTTIFSPVASWILIIAIFGFIGWTAVKDHKESKMKVVAWAGALTGIISGLVGAVIGILMFYIVPDVLLQAAAQSGANPADIQQFMAIGIYIGLITGPLFSALIGAGISAIAGLIAKKV